MRFGLVAHRFHRQSDGALLRWVRACDPGIRALGLGLHAVGGTCDALAKQGLLSAYPPLVRLPYGPEGGVMRLVSCIAGGLEAEGELDGIIYFVDPVDPSSLCPETQALKRQCVIHGKPYVAIAAGAAEWIDVELAHARKPCGNLRGPLASRTVACAATRRSPSWCSIAAATR
ncbi:methylglyoxal synthase [Variovorax sp. PBL-E5]|nr:methylglyoxal synthase [Variovorax sp. PBL-E5]